MLRENGVSDLVVMERRKQAELHYAKEDVQPDASTLADHELYILGKMDMEEYEQYLLLKHGQQTKEQGDS